MKVASLPLGMCLNTKINESSQFLNTKLKRYTEMDINICRLKKDIMEILFKNHFGLCSDHNYKKHFYHVLPYSAISRKKK